jgi:uncharacterized protein (DUF924 family)
MTSTPAPLPEYQNLAPTDVLTFWLGDGMTKGWPSQEMKDLWFKGSKGLDAQITARFGSTVEDALADGLQAWESAIDERLALVILLDQFTRNIFRGTARAFAGDARAQRLAASTLAVEEDRRLPTVARVFLYMPLMHAEDLSRQDTCVASFEQLLRSAPTGLAYRLQDNLDFARQHRDIIARFGRFPHRNAVLGRNSTPQETAFLQDGPRFGQ